MDNLDVKDIDRFFGTRLSNVSETVNSTQDAINQIAPVASFISKNWPLVLITLFVVILVASITANKITG